MNNNLHGVRPEAGETWISSVCCLSLVSCLWFFVLPELSKQSSVTTVWQIKPKVTSHMDDSLKAAVSNQLAPTAADTLQPDLQALLGPPALLDEEDPQAYEMLLQSVRTAVTPKDIIEEIWVRDVVDLVWEVLRLRRLKAALLVAAAQEGLLTILQRQIPYTAREVAERWARREAAAVEQVDNLLEEMELPMDAVSARTLGLKINEIERIDRMITSAEARRNIVLREIDRHRAALAAALRHASDNIRDAEFTEIRTDNPAP